MNETNPTPDDARLELIEGADHTFTPLWSQDRLTEMLERYLARWQGQNTRDCAEEASMDGKTGGAYLE